MAYFRFVTYLGKATADTAVNTNPGSRIAVANFDSTGGCTVISDYRQPPAVVSLFHRNGATKILIS